MKALGEAWNWYKKTKDLLKVVGRLGGEYWDELPWDGDIGRDDKLRLLEGVNVKSDADSVLAELDDLAIFVIFSVFEAIVRDHVAREVEAEVSGLRHPALQRSAKKTLQNIEEGSFYNNVLDLFKRAGNGPESDAANALVEEVSQVRRYRNWVAHGRREEKKPFTLAPRDAFDRLMAFLNYIGYRVPA